MTPGPSPRLSVIVPMYQAASTVAATVRSALADEVDGGVEVVVVDDGSTDGGARVVGEIVRRDGRVRLVARRNGGLSAARNTGIAHARGGWVRFLDADDLAIDGSAARLISHAARRGADAACGGHEIIDERGEPMGRVCPARAGADGNIGWTEMLSGNACGVGTVMIRRSALGDSRFDESLRVCEDWDLWSRLCGAGLRIACTPGAPVKRYRVRRASLSKDFGAMLVIGRAVMGSAMARARASGEARSADQCCERRERAAAGALALEWATMRAVSDADTRTTDAAEMFRVGGGLPFDGASAANAAFWGAVLGLGVRPERAGLERDAWLRRVRAWWGVCQEHGWLAADERERAWGALARLSADPMEVARGCIAAARDRSGADADPDRIVIIGAGINGRVAARATLERGLRPVYRDDRIDSGDLRPCDLECVESEPMEAPLSPREPAIIAATSDETLCDRSARFGVAPVRWSVVHSAVAAYMERELRADSIELRLGRAPSERCGSILAAMPAREGAAHSLPS